MRSLLVCSALLLGATCLAQSDKTPTVKEVRAAINRLQKTPKEATDTDLATAVRFAQESDECLVQIVADFVPKPEDTPEFKLLLGYYVAGAVLFDLDNPKLARDAQADKVAAIKSQLLIYREIKKKKPSYKNATLDNLAKLEKEGKLKDHIKKVMIEAAKK